LKCRIIFIILTMKRERGKSVLRLAEMIEGEKTFGTGMAKKKIQKLLESNHLKNRI